jgi:hypothetical protein
MPEMQAKQALQASNQPTNQLCSLIFVLKNNI